jgi:hypothetical protein
LIGEVAGKRIRPGERKFGIIPKISLAVAILAVAILGRAVSNHPPLEILRST